MIRQPFVDDREIAFHLIGDVANELIDDARFSPVLYNVIEKQCQQHAEDNQ